MRSPFSNLIENRGASAANGGRPRLRLIAINNRQMLDDSTTDSAPLSINNH